MRVALAISGGMDSLYSLSLLLEAGYEVHAVHGLFAAHAAAKQNPVPALQAVCKKLHVPLHVLDLQENFATKVIQPFVQAYTEGRTPNPCAHCNRVMKFGLFAKAAKEVAGADFFATGHYTALRQHSVYGATLHPAADATKDQAYFLSLVPREVLQTCLFPLANTIKKNIPTRLAALGLPVPLPRESQEICFIPGDDYTAFLKASQVPEEAGPVLLLDIVPPENGAGSPHSTILRRIATHKGLWHYTEGQRKGLGIAHSEPLYVLRKDALTNTLYVGPAAVLNGQGTHVCHAHSANFHVAPELWPQRVLVHTRYRQKPQPATAKVEGQNIVVNFADNAVATALENAGSHLPGPFAPGQIMAVYDDKQVLLAGAVIADHAPQ